MKNKIIYSLTMVGVLVLSIGLQLLEVKGKPNRTHQHRSDLPKEQLVEPEGFATHLPILQIDTGGQEIPGGEMLQGEWDEESEASPTILSQISLIESGPKMNQLTDEVQMASLANIRYRGNSSRYFDKKSIKVSLVDEKGGENPKELLGMASHEEWVLNGPILDRTLLRNYVAYNVAGEIMSYAPNVRYCELFVDGAYQGVYLLIENINRAPGRINIRKPERNRDRTSYIVRWDRAGKGNQEINNFLTYTYKAEVSGLDIRYPGPGQMTEGRKKYIEQDLSQLEKILYSLDLNGTTDDYKDYLDVPAFAQYFIINEFFGNVDAGRFSTFYYKDIRGKLTPCVWDFNNGADNYIDYLWDETGFTLLNAPIFPMLVKDKHFVDEVVSSYRKLRKGVLNEAYLLNYIDEVIVYLGDAIDRNYEVWGYVFEPEDINELMRLEPVERNYRSYEEAVAQLKDYIIRRGRWLDEHIDTLYQYAHPSRNTSLQIR